MISKMIDGQEVLMSGTSEALIAQKADKVVSATAGDLASLDSTGNLTDSGVKGDVSTTTLNGNPLSFTTDSEQAARECVITLEPLQAGSGDPSPSNVRDISGYDKVELEVPRKNFIDPNNFVQGLLDDAGVLHDTGLWISSNFIGIKSENVTVSGYKDGTEDNYFVRFCEYDENKVFISLTMNINVSSDSSYTRTLILNANTRFVRVSLGFNSRPVTPQTYFATNRVQLELGSTATTYEPYNPITDYSESLPETVYGGTLNVETGELVVDRGIVDLGSLDWLYSVSAERFFVNTSSLGLKGANDSSAVPNMKCSIYKEFSWNTVTQNTVNYGITIKYDGSEFNVRDIDYSDSAAFKNSLSGQMACCELYTPYTIHLTPAQVRLLQGNNVVTTNGTSIKLTYRNGEVATLADVSSVAESVNALGEKVEEVEDITKYIDLNKNVVQVANVEIQHNVVFIGIITKSGITISNNTLLGQLPTDYRPKIYVVNTFCKYSDGIPVSGSLWIYPNGSIRYHGETISEQISSSACYITK